MSVSDAPHPRHYSTADCEDYATAIYLYSRKFEEKHHLPPALSSHLLCGLEVTIGPFGSQTAHLCTEIIVPIISTLSVIAAWREGMHKF
jgi:hypothetical protein